MIQININDILEDILINRNSKNYIIHKYDGKIKIFNNEISILIYYVKYYTYDNFNFKDIINKIELDIGSYGFCNNIEENNFWVNLKKCIIVTPNELEYCFNINESKLIEYIKEKDIYVK